MKKYDVYVDGIKVASYDNYSDASLSKVCWKIIFEKECVIVDR